MPAQSPLSMLQVSGIDAKKLLQGQVTCNLDDVTPTSSLLGAHCNPQGRILSLFRLYWHAESYYLQMPAESVPHALKALQKYAAFYNVQLAEVASLDAIPEPPANWKLANITAGIPAIYPETTGKLLPHEINLQRLNAISFNKGCYTGQEIIARMHYRGTLKKQMFRARVHTQTAPQPGADIHTDQPAGMLVDSCQEQPGIYQVLVVANSSDKENQQLFLDPAKIELLEFLSLP